MPPMRNALMISLLRSSSLQKKGQGGASFFRKKSITLPVTFIFAVRHCKLALVDTAINDLRCKSDEGINFTQFSLQDMQTTLGDLIGLMFIALVCGKRISATFGIYLKAEALKRKLVPHTDSPRSNGHLIKSCTQIKAALVY